MSAAIGSKDSQSRPLTQWLNEFKNEIQDLVIAEKRIILGDLIAKLEGWKSQFNLELSITYDKKQNEPLRHNLNKITALRAFIEKHRQEFINAEDINQVKIAYGPQQNNNKNSKFFKPQVPACDSWSISPQGGSLADELKSFEETFKELRGSKNACHQSNKNKL